MEGTPQSPQTSLTVKYEAEIVRKARVASLSIVAFIVVMTVVTVGFIMLIMGLWPVSLAVITLGYGIAFLLVRTYVREIKRLDQFRIFAFKWSKSRFAVGLCLTCLAMALFGVASDRQGADYGGLVVNAAFLLQIAGFFFLVASLSMTRNGAPNASGNLEQWVCDHERRNTERILSAFEKGLSRASLYWKLSGAIGIGSLTLGILAMSGSDRVIVVVSSGLILAMAGVNYLLAVVYRRKIPAMKQELSGP